MNILLVDDQATVLNGLRHGIDFEKLNITGKQTVRDLWRQKDIKILDTGRKPLPLNVPAHGVLLYKFTPVQ